jgi:hypothetical protein
MKRILLIGLLILTIPALLYAGSTITRGKTFGSTDEVTNTALHQLVDSATIVRVTDADSDTKIDTEESSNENKVRIDTGGTERVVIESIGTRFTPPSAQTIAAGNTITADGCGGIKQITSAGIVTTDTVNTFTAPASTNSGCCMDVVNIGSFAITLDYNALFVSAGAVDVVLGAGDTCRVCSNASKWYQVSATGNN